MNTGYLAIIWHSRTGTSQAMARAVEEGARQDRAGEGPFPVRRIAACDVCARDLLDAGGYVFVCPENLASMSGPMKDMFDRTYYSLLGRIEGRPYATLIAAGSDGTGAQRQIDTIVTGWRLKRVAEPRILCTGAQTPEQILAPKHVAPADLAMCRELGEAIACGLQMGVF